MEGTGPEDAGYAALLAVARPGARTLDAAARLVADSVICAMAAARLPRMAKLREALDGGKSPGDGGAPAFLAGEAVNLLDADDTFFSAAHFGGLVSVVALAQAARRGANWGDLCRAVAAGFEWNARLNLALANDDGFLAPGIMLPGAVMTAAMLRFDDPAAVARAVSLSPRFMPAPVSRSLALDRPTWFKYGPYGPLAASALRAVDLAQAGYAAPAGGGLLDPETLAAQRLRLVSAEPLGGTAGTWWVEETSLKPWPTFRVGHPVLDAFRELCEGGLPPLSRVREIRLWLDPRALRLPFHGWPLPETRDDLLPVRLSMNLRLAVALLAAGVPAGGRWLDGSWMDDPAVAGWFAKVAIDPAPAISWDDLRALADTRIGRTARSFGRVRVTAANGVREAERDHADGDPWFADSFPGWPWLARKAASFLGAGTVAEVLGNAAPEAPVDDLMRAIGWPYW